MSSRKSTALLTATAVICGGGAWLGLAPGASAVDTPAVPFGSHSFSYASGTLKPTGDQAVLDKAVVNFYNKWKSYFIKQNCGNGWYEVYAADADHPYVAEAQGYGMVITALMAGSDPDAKKIFDGILKYVLAHKSVNNSNLHAAEQDKSCKSVNGSDSATDGDLDIAYGLLLADKQWGSDGTNDYLDLAKKRINAIKASELNSSTKLMKLGDWSSGSDDKISRTSDWMAGHFKAFKAATGDTTWDAVLSKTQTVIANLQSSYAPDTGLLPDFVVNTTTTPKPAPGEVLEDEHDGHYNWNACRDPWRIGSDAVINGDAKSKTAARKLNAWVKTKTAGNPSKIYDGYKLNGSAFSSNNEPAFFAPFAVSAMTDSGSQAWLDALWKKMLATTPSSTDYYSTSVQLQSMLVVTHNYWTP
ncbi:glycosyl hydrolase family 8 [Wenjunlia tyrosinilytica]|uniref:Licheninase n=1 Tax=Wenjunlia tyrosinilytica TaxID=1544741 RepID=A0A917ZTG4_9ACTN|nr:glycosyl hydrolase family 8 [Wenjunlia tyrosinilytica]GGO92833.1 licheninase [Wenjunlia tyrosinilytica]